MKTVLALNCGSSSLKFGVYLCASEEITLVCEGEAEEIGRRESSFWLKSSEESHKREERVDFPNYEAALGYSLHALSRSGAPEFQAVGHRFVHGGPQIREHRRVTPAILHQLEAAVDYAPLHLPPALAVLKPCSTGARRFRKSSAWIRHSTRRCRMWQKLLRFPKNCATLAWSDMDFTAYRLNRSSRNCIQCPRAWSSLISVMAPALRPFEMANRWTIPWDSRQPAAS